MCHGRVLLDGPNDMASKGGVLACELVREGGKDVPELPSIGVIPRAEEAGTEVEGFSLCNLFGKRLSDGGLPCSSQPVKPEDVSVLRICSPLHYPIKHGLPSPAETGVVMTCLVSCVVHGIQLSQQFEVRGSLAII